MTIKTKIFASMIGLASICSASALFVTVLLFNNYVNTTVNERIDIEPSILLAGKDVAEENKTILSFIGGGCVILLVVLAICIVIAIFITRNIEKYLKLINCTADGASQQAAAFGETPAAMNETSSMTAKTAENIRQAFQLVQKSKEKADSGKEKMCEMVESMEEFKKSGDTIARIIQTIDEIALQTNRLAVNAMIEAARAGDGADGSFASDANEVRKLAKKISEAAAGIAEIIEKNIALTNAGKEAGGEVTSTLEDITVGFENLTEMIDEIDAASAEESSGVKQNSIDVNQMEKPTQQNAAIIEETDASPQELKEQTGTLEKAASEASQLIKSAGIA